MFSDIYIEIKKNNIYDIYCDNNIFIIKKKLIDYDNKLSHQWGNVGNAILFDYKCIKNEKINQIKEDMFNIEKIIKNENFTEENTQNNIIYPTEHYIVKYLLPHFDVLDNNDINILKNAILINEGPLYHKMKHIRIPELIIDLIEH
jgi:hypothetical protein